tara:strand:+ start:287 stop:856 length:570 start_codon:yes stop_codon:yes gene_type:complete
MNNSLVIFFKNKSLFEIFDEIKDLFEYNIKFIKSSDELKSLSRNILEQHVVISEKTIRNLNNLNELVLEKKPITLYSLIELINISLMKNKFIEQSDLTIKQYKLDINARVLSKKDLNLKLTQKEIEIIIYLNDSNKNKTISDLEKDVWGYSPKLETHTVETHVYRLRKKILSKFNDDKFILSEENGYKI